ncbi:hypothetical protein [Aromatoleum buckelii]|uniref:Uncharacterized protein n=1 Tax=Aromatoleum buckelii TaxID=200254 RepID=A0ABX1N260_9RHOO|nr:hypothetical protein [Aromatoleum buckelii]MCK0510917.1 hypothetical protein [Aromatoleum buckelii]
MTSQAEREPQPSIRRAPVIEFLRAPVLAVAEGKKFPEPVVSTPATAYPQIAPAFRSYPPLPEKNSGRAYAPADDENLIRQQIDDLEHLHARGHRVEIEHPDADIRDLLLGEHLDISAARKFATLRVWYGKSRGQFMKVANKVALLKIPQHLQAELSRLYDDEHKAVRAKIRRREATVRRRLEKATAPQNMKYIPLWLDIWKCAQLLGDKSETKVAHLFKAMTGRTMHRKNVWTKLRALDRILGEDWLDEVTVPRV